MSGFVGPLGSASATEQTTNQQQITTGGGGDFVFAPRAPQGRINSPTTRIKLGRGAEYTVNNITSVESQDISDAIAYLKDFQNIGANRVTGLPDVRDSISDAADTRAAKQIATAPDEAKKKDFQLLVFVFATLAIVAVVILVHHKKRKP